MSAHGDNYVLDAGKSGHARLRAISEIHDERTRALVLDAGLEAGHRYVELAFAVGATVGVDYAAGRRLHRWASEAGFDVLRGDAYHPHYLTGEHKGFWSWTYREAGANGVKEGWMTEARYDEISEAMRAADDDPLTLVAHARTHQLVALKP